MSINKVVVFLSPYDVKFLTPIASDLDLWPSDLKLNQFMYMYSSCALCQKNVIKIGEVVCGMQLDK